MNLSTIELTFDDDVPTLLQRALTWYCSVGANIRVWYGYPNTGRALTNAPLLSGQATFTETINPVPLLVPQRRWRDQMVLSPGMIVRLEVEGRSRGRAPLAHVAYQHPNFRPGLYDPVVHPAIARCTTAEQVRAVLLEGSPAFSPPANARAPR